MENIILISSGMYFKLKNGVQDNDTKDLQERIKSLSLKGKLKPSLETTYVAITKKNVKGLSRGIKAGHKYFVYFTTTPKNENAFNEIISTFVVYGTPFYGVFSCKKEERKFNHKIDTVGVQAKLKAMGIK